MIISYWVYYSTKVSYPHGLLVSQPMCKETTVGTILVHETVRPTQSVATNSSQARPFPVLLQTKDENYPQEFVRNLLKSIRPNVFGTSDFLDQAHFLFTILNPVWVVRITLDYEIL